MQTKDPPHRPTRAIVAAVQLPAVSDAELRASLTELRELAKTLGYEVVGTFLQKRSSFDRAAYFGTGKREELRRFVANESSNPIEDKAESPAVVMVTKKALKDEAAKLKEERQSAISLDTPHVNVLLIDHDISPSQARNLELAVGCEVMDRTMVILEIFQRHASSRAARAQVEIARLGYMAPRLREAAKLAGPTGRQRSGTGGRGAGESKGQLDRQKIRNRIAELQVEITAMDADRQTQRARRQEGEGLARVALVGYTNAGKSTLMRALTGSEVLVANKLFATLDTTVRALHPASTPRVLVSDTVGFIKNLPHDLVASFKSTLEEAAESALLIHVIDASDPGFERQLKVTDEVLKEIGAATVPRIRVFNKIDSVGDQAAQAAHATMLRAQYSDCMVMSAKNDSDVSALHARICAVFQRDLIEAELFLPWSAQQMRGKIFASCEVLAERADDDGASFTVRGESDTVQGLYRQFGKKAVEKKVRRK